MMATLTWTDAQGKEQSLRGSIIHLGKAYGELEAAGLEVNLEEDAPKKRKRKTKVVEAPEIEGS